MLRRSRSIVLNLADNFFQIINSGTIGVIGDHYIVKKPLDVVKKEIDSLININPNIDSLHIPKYINCLVSSLDKNDSIFIAEHYNITYNEDKHDSIAFSFFLESIRVIQCDYYISINNKQTKYNFAFSLNPSLDYSHTYISIGAISKDCQQFQISKNASKIYNINDLC